MTWIAFALGAALLTSFNPLLYKQIVSDVEPLVVVWLSNLVGLPLLGWFALSSTAQLPALDPIFALAVLGSAVLNVVAHLSSVKALRLDDVSLVIPLLTFSPIVTVLVASPSLGELPGTAGVIGMVLVLAGAYALGGPRRGDWSTPFRELALRPGTLLVLSAGVLWGITPVLEKFAIRQTDPYSPRIVAFAVQSLLVLILTLPVLVHRRSLQASIRAHLSKIALLGMIAGSAPVLGYTALSLGPAGYVATLFKFSALMTVLWAAVILREGGMRRRIPASLLMVVGTILLAW